jgi:hypothetical protein
MWIVIACIAFITIVSVAVATQNTIRHKDKLDLIRFAIEKGHPIEPTVIDKLMQPEPSPQQPEAFAKRPGQGLRIGAIMCFAVAVGLPVLGYFLSSLDKEVFVATRAAGAFLACIATGMLTASIYMMRMNADQGA